MELCIHFILCECLIYIDCLYKIICILFKEEDRERKLGVMVFDHQISFDSQQKLIKFSEVTNLNNRISFPKPKFWPYFWDDILL